jgi:hypothetical protein
MCKILPARSQFARPGLNVMLRHIVVMSTLVLHASVAHAQFEPNKVMREAGPVAQRFPDPAVQYSTPGFRPGREDFTTHAEMLAFLEALARESRRVKIESLGSSQRGLSLPLVLLTDSGELNSRLPTVLIIGQQHGNEPAGGEAALVLAQQLANPRAGLLGRVNVLIVPRGNPDGAESFKRTTANGIDVNRDHLLLNTPESRTIALAVHRYRPHLMLDLHEFTVGGRWVAKFGGVMKYDALVQAATVGNLDPQIAIHAQRDYVQRIHAMFASNGLASFGYHTTGVADPEDKIVSMGGVQPDTGRNVGGLRPAISLLIEARGVGIGRAHFLRRVHTHVLAANTVLETAAAKGGELIRLTREAEQRALRGACRGNMVVEARLTPARERLTFLDAATGQDLPTEVAWRAASPLSVVRWRARPCGYLVASDEAPAIERLRLLGAKLYTVVETARWKVERYTVTREVHGQREDARGAIADDHAVRKVEVRTEHADEVIAPGTVFVPLSQPLSPLISAALEPDSQSSFLANRVLNFETSRLRRVMRMPTAATISAFP